MKVPYYALQQNMDETASAQEDVSAMQGEQQCSTISCISVLKPLTILLITTRSTFQLKRKHGVQENKRGILVKQNKPVLSCVGGLGHILSDQE